MASTDNWSEWRQFILSTLKDLSAGQEESKKNLSEIHGDIREINQSIKHQSDSIDKLSNLYMHTQAEVAKTSISSEALKKSDDDKEARLRTLEKDSTSSGTKWSVAQALVTALVAGLVSLVTGFALK